MKFLQAARSTAIALLFFFIGMSCFTLATAEEELPELMRELQQLTHKLSLATHHKNAELSRYYLEKSIELVEKIQEKIPEDHRLPIAVFIDRFSRPAYGSMNVLLAPTNQEFNPAELKPAMDGIIESCNACHKATNVGFIKIVNATSNHSNQDFKP